MKTSYKILLGVASIWPIIYVFLFVAFIFGMIAYTGTIEPQAVDGQNPEPLSPIFGTAFLGIFVLHFLTIMLSLGLKIYFIIHIIKNTALESNIKIIWLVVLFFAGMLAEPIYWYMNIWRDPRPGQTPSQPEPLRSDGWVPPPQPPDWR